MTLPHPGGLVAYQSDRISDLVDRLVAGLLRDEQQQIDTAAQRPFVEHTVVVPTRNLEDYLTFEIAARRGVASGIDFVTIERFLESLLPDGDDERPEIRILDQTAMTRLVLSVFDDPEVMERTELSSVRRFLYPDADPAPRVVQRRRFQLAFRIARLFEEYGYARRNLLRHWREGNSGLDEEYGHLEGPRAVTPADRQIERWQMTLWRELFGAEGAARKGIDGDDRPWMTLPEAVIEYASPDGTELRWPQSVHVFGHSYLPKFFRGLFSRRTYAEDHRISLYVLNPCLEYWGTGIAGDRDEDPVFEILTDESPLQGDEYPLALQMWGRAGRDYQRMIEDVAHDRVDVSADTEPPRHTLLQHFQAMIRNRETARESFDDHPLPEDKKSLNFWSCASVQRECEAIASEIWELVTTHDDLRFNDIAVVVQPKERTLYQTHLRAAFEQTGRIPSNTIDVDGTESSPFLEAVELLLSLPLGEFRRGELLALLVHPCFVANVPEAEEEAWLNWCDELNIFQGGTTDDLEGTYLDEDRFTWQQGIRRLVLGAFMSQPDAGHPASLAIGDDRYLPHETNHGDVDTVGALAMLADELIADARRFRDERRSLGEWMEVFADRIGRYLEALDRRQRRTRMELLGALQRIAEVDPRPGEQLGYYTAREFALAQIAKIEQTRGQYLADGVVVSAFRPMRPIPFEVVFVTGLGEGDFPAPNPPDTLDLRRVVSEEHDVNPRYRDQYMFLETLISTRSRLYLSWVGRHEVTGDELEPASVVHQLREMILQMAPNRGEDAERIRGGLEERIEILEHPLRRYSSVYFPSIDDGQQEAEVIDARGADAIPPRPPDSTEKSGERSERLWPNHHLEARREGRVQSIRRRLLGPLDGYRPTMAELKEGLDESVFCDLAELLQWHPPPETERRIDGDRVVLRLRDLRNFLLCPLQGSARVVLGIYSEDEGDVLDSDHEPFEAEFLTRLKLVRGAFRDALMEGEIDEASRRRFFDRRAEAARLSGELPAGIFFDAERDRCLQMLGDYTSGLEEGLAAEGRLRRIRFGASRRRGEVDEIRDPLVIDVELGDRSVEVELHAGVDVFGDDNLSLLVAAGRKAGAKYHVRGGIDQILLSAGGVDVQGKTVVLTKKGEFDESAVSIDTAGEARAYLRQLAGDVLSGLHDYFLPVEFAEAIVEGPIDDPEAYLREAENKKRPGWNGNYRVSSQYGPVRRWMDAEPLSLRRATDVVRRRYAPFLEIFRGE